MTVWNLVQGMEAPVQTTRLRRMGNLTPADVAKRAEELGARVELTKNKYHVYPPDSKHNPVFFGDRFANGRDRPNVVAALRRVGLDVLSEKHKEESEVPAAKKPTTSTVSPLRRRVDEIVSPGDSQQQIMLDMLAEMEARLDDLEIRLAATPGAPPPRNPHAELDEAILGFMRGTPIKLSAGVIAANLDLSGADAERVAERLNALGATEKVVATELPSGEKVYKTSEK